MMETESLNNNIHLSSLHQVKLLIIVIETTILIFLQNKNWPEFSRFKPAEKEENHLENFLCVIFLYYV